MTFICFMKKLFQIKLIGLLVVISIISCQDPLPLEDSQLELESSSPVQLSSRTTEAEEGSDTYGFGPQIVLGEELVSAYEVDNMIEAAQSLYPELTHDEVTSLIATLDLRQALHYKFDNQ